MKRYPLVLMLLLIAQWSMSQSSPFFLGGIQVNEPDHNVWMEGLQQAGMNTVAVTAYAKQGNWDSDHLWWEAEEPAVVAEIATAKQHGLHVVFIARVALDHSFAANANFWHGMIMPHSDAQIDSWFAQYTQFVVQWAQQCETLGVDVFGIGSEMRVLSATVLSPKIPRLEGFFLNPLSRRLYKQVRRQHREEIVQSQWWRSQGQPDYDSYLDREIRAHTTWAKQITFHGKPDRNALMNERRRKIEGHWRTLIAEVRKVYHGKLTYAANFDNYDRVGFWDALDIIGINAYFPLTDQVSLPDSADLLHAWQQHSLSVDYHLQQRGVPDHPVIFTELGYIKRSGTLTAPWSGFGFSIMPRGLFGHSFHLWEEKPISLQDRAQAVTALADAKSATSWGRLQGILYWKLTTVPHLGSIEPFALVLGQQDPLEEALRRFVPLTTKYVH